MIRTFALAAVVLAPATAHAQRADSASFVTLLGRDTMVVERVVRTPGRVEAEVVLRVPRTTLTRSVMTLAPDGGMERLESTTYAVGPDGRPAGEATRREVIARSGDSLRVETTGGPNARTRTVAAPREALVFIDMVHWPFDLALERARSVVAGSEQVQPLLSGNNVAPFRVGRIGADSMTITHPFRGTMRVRTNAEGQLAGLDAGATTRKLVVTRRPWVADAALARMASAWRAADEAGRSMGALSGRGESMLQADGGTVTVNFGTPSMRGRTIWGALVPYGQVWRTGANEATHLATDRTLVLGSGSDTLVVPPGRYTLYSIPAADGGTLIVNTQTGQGGTTYNQDRDLGRVRLMTRPLAQPVETFTIDLDARDRGHELALKWDRTALVVPVRVVSR